MGAPKKYTPESLKRKVNQYFADITRVVTVTEKRPTGEKDEMGHMIFEDVPVLNRKGKEVQVEEYIVPPTIGDLSLFLKIHRSTWAEYCEDPEFSDTTTYARGRIQAYLERESLTRSGKDIKGIIFNLEQNFGAKEKVEISAGEGFEDYLSAQMQSGGGQEF